MTCLYYNTSYMNRIKLLLLKKIREGLDHAEQQELELWLAHDPANRELHDGLNDAGLVAESLKKLEQYDEKNAWNKLQVKLGKGQAVHQTRLYRLNFTRRFRWVAAAVLLFAIGTTYFLLTENKTKPALLSEKQRFKNDVVPGKKGSLIRLADGRTIDVNSAPVGLIAMQGNVQVIKDANGQIHYEGMAEAGTILYNEVITQGGEEQTVNLPDHSVAILNNGSSIKYPLQFSGNERLVSMTGEAYFKVVHNAAMPFRVSVKGQLIEDIGTEFNVSAYADETVLKTTLVEGSVKMGNSTVKAGQQAVVSNGSNIIISNADTDLVTAWIHGLFSYDDADLETVMRQVGRWYKVDVTYQAGAPAPHFWGDMRRDATLVSILKVLEESGVRFMVEGNKVTVLAN